MVRASAKNSTGVAILCKPSQYAEFLRIAAASAGGCSTTKAFRTKLAAAAFATTAAYDAQIAQYFAAEVGTENNVHTVSFEVQRPLKYGCNPHQDISALCSLGGLDGKLPFEVVNGTPGYINLLDAINAWQLVFEAEKASGLPAAASFKHVSPAGAAIGVPLSDLEKQVYEVMGKELTPTATAYVRARNADPMCSFGDFVAISCEVDEATANILKIESLGERWNRGAGLFTKSARHSQGKEGGEIHRP